MALVRRVPLGAPPGAGIGAVVAGALNTALVATGNALARFTGSSTHHALARKVLGAEARRAGDAAGRAAFRAAHPPPLECRLCRAPIALQRAFEAHVRTHGRTEQARLGTIRRRLNVP